MAAQFGNICANSRQGNCLLGKSHDRDWREEAPQILGKMFKDGRTLFPLEGASRALVLPYSRRDHMVTERTRGTLLPSMKTALRDFPPGA